MHDVEDHAFEEREVMHFWNPRARCVRGLARGRGVGAHALRIRVWTLATERRERRIGAALDHLCTLGGAELVKRRLALVLVPHIVPFVLIQDTRRAVVNSGVIGRNYGIAFVVIVNARL